MHTLTIEQNAVIATCEPRTRKGALEQRVGQVQLFRRSAMWSDPGSRRLSGPLHAILHEPQVTRLAQVLLPALSSGRNCWMAEASWLRTTESTPTLIDGLPKKIHWNQTAQHVVLACHPTGETAFTGYAITCPYSCFSAHSISSGPSLTSIATPSALIRRSYATQASIAHQCHLVFKLEACQLPFGECLCSQRYPKT